MEAKISTHTIFIFDNFDNFSIFSLCVDFGQFKIAFDKVYADETEEKYRQSIYRENLQIIEAYNFLYEKGFETYSWAINKFADWTHEEFVSRHGRTEAPVDCRAIADPYFASRAAGDNLFIS